MESMIQEAQWPIGRHSKKCHWTGLSCSRLAFQFFSVLGELWTALMPPSSTWKRFWPSNTEEIFVQHLAFLVGALQRETWVTCQHVFHCVHHWSQLQDSSEAEMK